MSGRNVWRILRKDLKMGPRSPLLLWALVLPAIMTITIRGVFGGLFDPEPRLGIADEGASTISSQVASLDGVESTFVTDRQRLLDMVEANDVDAGLILPAGFDAAVRAGDQPTLLFYVSGDSLASNRIILSVTTMELVRGVAGAQPPVNVDVVSLGEPGIELTLRLLPMIVVFAVAVSGVFVTAAALVQEKERRTLDAVLVTPITTNEVLVAKASLGAILAVVAGFISLALNDAFGSDPLAMSLTVIIGAVMMAEIGLILGAWAANANMMFTAWKSGAILLMYPVVFYVWQDLPQWIAKTGPTYYFLQPVYALAVETASLGDVWQNLAIAVIICIAIIPLVTAMGRFMERRMATGKIAHSATPEPAEELVGV